MPRLFTALEVPQPYRSQLSLSQSGLPGMRWLEPADFHITLRFIGDVDGRMADEIIAELSRLEWTAPRIEISTLAAFGGKKPSSIHASVLMNDDLKALHDRQDRVMSRFGLPPDPRRFTPHITLGRCRGLSSEKIAQYLSQRGGLIVPPYNPDRFVMYSARESVGGGPYRVEHSWKLNRREREDNFQTAQPGQITPVAT